ncbi:MAG: hypothetical protein FJ388_04205 [Verrucomicrobia bacterium]|nr:hypothetical protein [Verrucomicrobiota bacterium]
MNDTHPNQDSGQPAPPFDPGRAAQLRAQAIATCKKNMKTTERALYVQLVVFMGCAIWMLHNFWSSTGVQSMILNAVLFLLFLEGAVLMKLWYWIVTNRLSVLREIKLLRLDLAIQRGTEQTIEEIAAIESPMRPEGLSKVERWAWKLAILAVAAASVVAFGWWRSGQPSIAVSSKSPDGRYIALVRNHPSFDPPNQSLWVGRADGDPQKVRHLDEDIDWCNQIVWSADSSAVAFLVQDARLMVVDAATGEIRFDRWLVKHADYPTRDMVKDLSLSADGSEARFRTCLRKGGTSSDWQTVKLR